jgi:glycerol-1-phosphate dehydrogenase [NAD(P)+]
MERDGLKVSLPSRCADVIIGDIEIMKEAPLQLMQAGLGDMLAKYVSICEWRIAHMITGEYYSEEIAQMVREARDRCVQNSQGLMRREDEAVKAVFEGLIICDQAMALAGLSRPASGVEHYFSHIWDMRALEWGDKASLHGLQCGVGTLLAVRLYEQIRTMVPDKEKAFRYVEAFDFGQWSQVLREFLGKGAETMIAQEAKEQKYSAKKHAERFKVIAEKWQEIVTVMEEELPTAKALEECLVQIGAPVTVQELGVDPASVVTTFQATKDIRDKYVLSRLAWDLGVLEDLKSL